jgi:signal peptidase I
MLSHSKIKTMSLCNYVIGRATYYQTFIHMAWKIFSRKKELKPKSWLQEWREAIVFAVVVATLIRWGTVEAFVIPTPSMENSLMVGEYLFVSKIHYGSRTPRTPLQVPLTHQKFWGTEIPSYLDWIQLPSWRLPGISHVQREDVVVFNVPDLGMNDGIERPVDLKTYYVKRCVGIPGDTLSVVDRQLNVNGQNLLVRPGMKFSYLVTAEEEITKRAFRNLQVDADDYYFFGRMNDGKALYKMFLTQAQLEMLRAASYVTDVRVDHTTQDGPDADIFPLAKNAEWNGDNYGPLIIPQEGMTIAVNDSTMALYGETIRLFEHHDNVTVANGTLTIEGQALKEYIFRQDYYFMMGDNRNNSLDSRYWGFVPYDHIVGKPLFVFFSVDQHADLLDKIRWSRIFTLVE